MRAMSSQVDDHRCIPSRCRAPRATVALLCTVLLLPAGCRMNPLADDIPPPLWSQVKTFEDTVRWGDLANTVLFLGPAERAEAQVQPGIDNVRVTGYEASPMRQADEYRWTGTAVIDYVLTDTQVVRRLVDHQVWRSDDEGDTWYREPPLPVFR
jgi:hypothetical protein